MDAKRIARADEQMRKRCDFFDRRPRAAIAEADDREALESYHQLVSQKPARRKNITEPFLDATSAARVLGALLSHVHGAYGSQTVRVSKNNLRIAESFLKSCGSPLLAYAGGGWSIDGDQVSMGSGGLGLFEATFQATVLLCSPQWLICIWFKDED